MLHKYRFKNFFSFAGETEVSFLLNRQTPVTDLVFESPGGARLSKVVAAIGPNASGKTNVLKPLAFLSWFVTHSFTASFSRMRRTVSLRLNSRTKASTTAIHWLLTRNGWCMSHYISRLASSSALFFAVTGLSQIRLMKFGNRSLVSPPGKQLKFARMRL